ncbi:MULTISPECIES: hypothetical protein [unclassified Cryobacterium]|uniref:hypothetical protein n=1 Tax=unclassified Cryobacterium TaxID=2649013 RepID=UPI002AB39235|nr:MULTISPECIES: hypothetical protein [unclassified Cryobacterium]MDY7529429.1 hypothetical protein [Cryobacterium sp. 10C2]MDY7558423.1 hypothetical protein [Cryobacterium sp. 10C3]MEB0201661.1 hypothetical protein [Cryobacterium sp. 5I3]MEB0290729.1 hypothetical protein [Cryobacterium sp. 10C2]
MKTRSGIAAALSVVAICAVVGVAVYAAATGAHSDAQTAAATQFTPQAIFAGLTPSTGNPELESLNLVHPSPGTIVAAAGPFDDRFVLEGLTFDGGAVSGAVRVTSDVSDVLDLEVLAGFYDADGVLVGSGRFVHHLSEDTTHTEPPIERQEFTIAVPGDVSGRAVAVSIGVPVLVNE